MVVGAQIRRVEAGRQREGLAACWQSGALERQEWAASCHVDHRAHSHVPVWAHAWQPRPVKARVPNRCPHRLDRERVLVVKVARRREVGLADASALCGEADHVARRMVARADGELRGGVRLDVRHEFAHCRWVTLDALAQESLLPPDGVGCRRGLVACARRHAHEDATDLRRLGRTAAAVDGRAARAREVVGCRDNSCWLADLRGPLARERLGAPRRAGRHRQPTRLLPRLGEGVPADEQEAALGAVRRPRAVVHDVGHAFLSANDLERDGPARTARVVVHRNLEGPRLAAHVFARVGFALRHIGVKVEGAPVCRLVAVVDLVATGRLDMDV
mmetsp:Transcript_18843/g.55705  ORF Transcript_18843/g.55705 Transcript_18843/m.55705 type:complete len:332 (-) Transcript_18843:1005-2000(-)